MAQSSRPAVEVRHFYRLFSPNWAVPPLCLPLVCPLPPGPAVPAGLESWASSYKLIRLLAGEVINWRRVVRRDWKGTEQTLCLLLYRAGTLN